MIVRRIGSVISAFLVLYLLIGCSRRPLIEMEAVSPLLESISRFSPEITSFKGFGQITFSEQGMRQSGRIDALWSDNGDFSAYIYSPFGTTVASVEGDRSGGKVAFDQEELLFGMDERLVMIPFSWGKNVNFSQFIRYFTGRMPETAIMERAPDSISLEGNYARATWHDHAFSVTAVVSRRSQEIETVEFQFPRHGLEPWNLQFTNFNQGLASQIKIEENSRNYILIRYNDISADLVSHE